MVVGMQHQQQQPHASPATVLEDATTPCVGSPPLNTPSTVDSASDDVSDGSESSTPSVGVAPESSMAVAVPATVISSLYSNNRVKLREVNPHLVCVLCHGYFVDATSIAECLHSFCRSCIILHLGRESCCPICKVQINNSKPHLSLKPDKTLQDVVYKLVPGLFHAEMKRRNQFYQSHPDRDLHLHPEFRGITVDRLVYSPEDSICLSLEYYDKSKEKEWETVGSHHVDHDTSKINLDERNAMPKKYFVCPADVRVMYLKKIIRLKYNLEDEHKVELFYRRESLPDEYSLMDIAYIYTWKRNLPMRLYYKINILATVTEPAHKIAVDMVEQNSSQLSPASEQELAVGRNYSVNDEDNNDHNMDAVEQSITLSSPSTNKLKTDDDDDNDDDKGEETCKKPVIPNGNDQVVEGGISMNKTASTISCSLPPITKISKSATSVSSTPTTLTKSTTGRTKGISSDKKDTVKSKLKPLSTLNLKPVCSETRNQTPIKSYLSISSILSDIEKPEVSKKPLVKNGCKSSDNENTSSNIPETSVVKSHSASPALLVPSSTFATTTTVSANAFTKNDSTFLSESDSSKTTDGEFTTVQSTVKTKATSTPIHSDRSTSISTLGTTGGGKTPVSTPITIAKKTPILASTVVMSNHSCKISATSVPSTPNTGDRKTSTVLPVIAQSIGIRVPTQAKSPSRNMQAPKVSVSAQNSDIKTSVVAASLPKSPVSNSGAKTTLVTSSLISHATKTLITRSTTTKVTAAQSPMKPTPIFSSNGLASSKLPLTLLLNSGNLTPTVTSVAKANPVHLSTSTYSSAKTSPANLIASTTSLTKVDPTNFIMSTASPSTVNLTNSLVTTNSLAKSLSIPSSTSITVSSKSLPPPLITLTSTPTMSTFVTSKDLTASQYIPPNTKIPSSLEISLKSSKEVTKLSMANTLPKMVPPLTNGSPKSHFIGKKAAPEDICKSAVKRALNDDNKSIGEPEKKIIKQSNNMNGPPKKIFSHNNILPEVSITLNPHPEQNKRISPETSYDVSCFKPNDVHGLPPLTPINSPICKNIQNSPIKNLNNKKFNGVRIVRNSSFVNSPSKLKHSILNVEKTNGETEAKKLYLENGSQQNGFFESKMNGKEKSTTLVESTTATTKPNETKTSSPTLTTKKEARHLSIPKLIDIKAAPYSKLITQDAKARLQLLKNALYVNPSTEPVSSDNALDLSPSSKSPLSDKSDSSPDKKKLIPSVPPHMIPVTMARNDKKPKTSPTNTIAKMDQSPFGKTDFRLENGSPSTPKTTRLSNSPKFSKTPSPNGGLNYSPPDFAINQALALNFLQHHQQSQELLWLMHACQNGQLPSHPLMHKSTKSPTSTSENGFQTKK